MFSSWLFILNKHLLWRVRLKQGTASLGEAGWNGAGRNETMREERARATAKQSSADQIDQGTTFHFDLDLNEENRSGSLLGRTNALFFMHLEPRGHDDRLTSSVWVAARSPIVNRSLTDLQPLVMCANSGCTAFNTFVLPKTISQRLFSVQKVEEEMSYLERTTLSRLVSRRPNRALLCRVLSRSASTRFTTPSLASPPPRNEVR